MSTFLRWLKFNGVGGIGVGVQLSALHVLLRAHAHYLVATLLAVECAVLHNFFWHQRYTWADRLTQQLREKFLRLVRFNVSNGLVSIAGNLLIMKWLVGSGKLSLLAANLVAILVCSLLNFLLGDRFVFRNSSQLLLGACCLNLLACISLIR